MADLDVFEAEWMGGTNKHMRRYVINSMGYIGCILGEI